jgi:outer membrane protein
MRRTLSTTIGLLVALVGPARGQEPTFPSVPPALGLRDAIELARIYNPTLRQTQNARSTSGWAVRNAYASFLPGVNASFSMGYAGAGTQAFLAENFVQPSSTIGSSYNLGMSLQISGRTLMQTGVANAQYRATEATIEGAEINLEATVRQQYLAVLQAEATVDLGELQVARNEEFLRLAQARFQVGQNTMLDVRQAEVAKGQSDINLLRARQAVVVEKLRLFQTIGVPAPDSLGAVTLTDSFPVTPPAWQLAELLAEADAANPDVTALRAQLRSAQASERASKSTWLPTLSLSAGWSGFTQQFTNSDYLVARAEQSANSAVAQCQFTEQYWLNPGVASPIDCQSLAFDPASAGDIRAANNVFPFNFTSQPFRASLTLSLPIFTQLNRPLEIAQAAERADNAAESLRARELQVRTDVSQAYYALLAAYDAITIQERNLTAAGEQLRLATERYRVGSGTFFELLDAQVAAQQAEADYVNAIYAYHRSIASLEAAVGRPLR